MPTAFKKFSSIWNQFICTDEPSDGSCILKWKAYLGKLKTFFRLLWLNKSFIKQVGKLDSIFLLTLIKADFFLTFGRKEWFYECKRSLLTSNGNRVGSY